MLLGDMPTKEPGPDLVRVTAELRREVERRVEAGTKKETIAREVGILPSEFTRKLQLKGRNRFNVDEVFRLAAYLGGPLGWPFLPMSVALRLTLKADKKK